MLLISRLVFVFVPPSSALSFSEAASSSLLPTLYQTTTIKTSTRSNTLFLSIYNPRITLFIKYLSKITKHSSWKIISFAETSNVETVSLKTCTTVEHVICIFLESLSLFPCFFSASIYFKRDEDSIMELAFPECREQTSGLELALDNEPKRASGIRGDGGKEGRVCVKSTRDKISRVSNPGWRFPRPGKNCQGVNK